MAYSEEEANPLLSSSGPRRRAPASQVSNRRVEKMATVGYDVSNCFQKFFLVWSYKLCIWNHYFKKYYIIQNRFSTSNAVEDFSKKGDKRSVVKKVCTACKVYACARPELDTTAIYYEDTYNDEPWDFTFGTSFEDGVWVNFGDQVGTIMASLVWVLIIYSVITISLLAHNQKLSNGVAMLYATVCALALACHAKTTFTDPGSIPQEAVPREALMRQGITTHAMCSHCQTYKPPNSHHCRICNRCISRMDHHCPWMNNCVGAYNFSEYFYCCTISNLICVA